MTSADWYASRQDVVAGTLLCNASEPAKGRNTTAVAQIQLESRDDMHNSAADVALHYTAFQLLLQDNMLADSPVLQQHFDAAPQWENHRKAARGKD